MKPEECLGCKDSSTSSCGDKSLFYWILGTLCFPIGLPLAAFAFWRKLMAEKHRNCLRDKVVLITGASSGLGEALAHTFYNAGCKVILAARRVDELERVKNQMLASKAHAIAYPPAVLPLDLSELNAIPRFAEQALNVHNQIDILVNNGGISVRADVLSTAVDVDLKVMLVNYFGAVALTKAILPHMVDQKAGHVCFISSVQGKFALPHRSAYSASKHAVQAFADSLRAEVASKGIKVTCISPGYIRTQLSRNALTSTGEAYGKMDETTAAGTPPDLMAEKIMAAISHAEKDVVFCELQARIAFFLRFLCPSLYFWIMEKRALKLERNQLKE